MTSYIVPTEIQDVAMCELTNSLMWTNFNSSGWQCHQNSPLIPVCNSSTSLWSGVTCVNDIVTSIVLQSQGLQGYISTSIGYLTGLFSIDFTSNRLTGSIPSSIGFLNQLKKLALSYNNIGGTIPEQLMYLTGLSILTIGINKLTGTLPSSIGKLSKLTTLSLITNHLTGKVPLSIYSLPNLQNLYLQTNCFTGTIPSDISKLQLLQSFTIHNNSINGPIPTTISQLSYCYLFAISMNKLTGTIPTELGAMTKMMYLLMGKNSLSGSFPTILGNLKLLILFNIYQNQLTGTIPTEYYKWNAIRNLQFHSNRLTGTIPSSFGYLLQLQYIRLDSNFLTGSIPSSILMLKALKGFEVGNNQLTGTLPLFSRLPQIQIIRLNNNKLSGTISENTFNASKLVVVDISNNYLSGRLPSLPFQASGLNLFAASVNCFKSYLPSEICQAVNLQTLALDGMRVAESCRSAIFEFTSIKTYRLTTSKNQVIPSCIFSMPQLKTLHLSGNALKGNLPADVTLNSHFVVLTLSNNLLSGSIPANFQERHWDKLDLSYNKFDGVLSGDFEINDNSTLRLNVNRLSGKVPNVLYDAKDIAILEGNMFECYLRTQWLPKNDPKADQYICGSDSIMLSCIIFVALLLSCGGFFLYGLMRARRKGRGRLLMLLKKLKTYVISILYIENNMYNNYLDDEEISFSLLMKQYRKFISIISFFILVVCLPTYSSLGIFYSTHHERYGWKLSVAFLSGKCVTIALVTVWPLLLLIIALNNPVHSQRSVANSTKVTCCHWLRSTLVFLCLLVINFIVIIPVVGLYVYSSVAYKSTIMTFIQIGIGIFKASWSEFYVKNFAMFERMILPTAQRNNRSEMISIAIILIINNIIIPVLAEAAIDSNCYYHAMKDPPSVSVSYSYGDPCTFIILGVCTSPNVGTSTITYTPPFIYSYQCSSILITNFSSVFMYMFVAIAIFSPFRCKLIDTIGSGSDKGKWTRFTLSMLKVHVPAYLGELLSYLAILITFGAVFPPLALVMYVAISVDIYYAQKVLYPPSPPLSSSSSSIIAIEDKDDSDNSQESIPVLNLTDMLHLCPFAAIFYSFFLVDILGDDVGIYRGYWAPVFIISLSLVIFVIFYCRSLTPVIKEKMSERTVVPIIVTID